MDKIIHGDSTTELKKLADNSVDLVCTDPPYGYSFMGKNWDKAVPSVEIWKQCLRVLKPGGFAFVMSAPRQDVLSQMIVRIGEAGFDTDFTSIYWTYASGFPKAANMGKMVDKRLGVDKLRKFKSKNPADRPYTHTKGVTSTGWQSPPRPDKTFSHSSEAKALEGSYGGFQPKPAVEVIIVAMKPLSEKTFVDQALKNGKGITWLDDCRVPTSELITNHSRSAEAAVSKGKYGDSSAQETHQTEGQKLGRFPANLLVENDVLDYNEPLCEDCTRIAEQHSKRDEAGTKETTRLENLEAKKPKTGLRSLSKVGAKLPTTEQPCQQLDLHSLISEDGSQSEAPTATAPTGVGCEPSENVTDINASGVEQQKTSTLTTSNHLLATPTSDTKSATGAYCALHATGRPRPTESNQQYSRFFSLDAWAQTLPFLITPKASKSEKNEGLDGFPLRKRSEANKMMGDAGVMKTGSGNDRTTEFLNNHPTVKPLKLMSYLITLGSREGDVVLEPFMGSGTTCIAAKNLNRRYIGIEREKEYVDIARARLKAIPPRQLSLQAAE